MQNRTCHITSVLRKNAKNWQTKSKYLLYWNLYRNVYWKQLVEIIHLTLSLVFHLSAFGGKRWCPLWNRRWSFSNHGLRGLLDFTLSDKLRITINIIITSLSTFIPRKGHNSGKNARHPLSIITASTSFVGWYLWISD